MGEADLSGEIGTAVITPEAEPNSPAPAQVSAKQEADFYTDAKRQYDLENNRQNLGTLGGFFGANSSAPTNIAGAL
jgi:hypothetical protein